MEEYNPQSALYDLDFSLEPRGLLKNGEPLTPYICVRFEEAFGAALSFKCFRVEAVERKEI